MSLSVQGTSLSSRSSEKTDSLNRLWGSKSGQVLLLGILAGLSLAGYLLYCNALFRNGFPLDDAWIHQTYARNLAHSGQMAFFPGQPSAGSTSPAWTVLLAAGYLFQIHPLAWAYFWGWFLLWGMAVIAWAGFGIFGFSKGIWAFAAGSLLALEWHLVWAAGSGMETLLQADIVLLLLVCLLWLERAEGRKQAISRKLWPWLLLGILAGLSVWVRPDGLTLLGLAGWVILFGAWPPRTKLRTGLLFVAGFSLLFLPYLWYNRQLSGELWPNTFYAKQAEYAILRGIPFWQRILAEFKLPTIGVGILLLPGVVIAILVCLQMRQFPLLGGIAWLCGYLVLYAVRLPVVYQHGRYIIPAMPVFFFYGMAGLAFWFEAMQSPSRFRLLNRVWALTCFIVLVCFWLVGGRSYAWDVAVIESEMVDTARWIEGNTGPEARLAAHDIGALGYFGGRAIVDLAGLVSPEVIPILRDEKALGEFLVQEKVEYLVTFPDWYPELVKQRKVFYTTLGSYSPKMGGENMTVYRWSSQGGN